MDKYWLGAYLRNRKREAIRILENASTLKEAYSLISELFDRMEVELPKEL